MKDRAGEARHVVRCEVDPDHLRALKRAVQDAGKEARRSVRARLKPVGTLVADEIKRRTPVHQGRSYGKGKRARASVGRSGGSDYRQRHAPGLLKKSTKLKIGSMSVTVYNDAKAKSRTYPGGYRYGKRLEFDPRFSGRFEFFYPGFEARREQAAAEFEKVLADIESAFMRS